MRRREYSVTAMRILFLVIRLAVAACYVSLAAFVLYFPFAYVGRQFISPLWRQYPFVKHMRIEDSMPYIFGIAMLCTLLQLLVTFIRRRINKDFAD